MSPTSLDDLPKGTWAEVKELIGAPALTRRLMEIGFTPGEAVRRVAYSPFNDPMAVNIRGTVFALRREEACCIKVLPF